MLDLDNQSQTSNRHPGSRLEPNEYRRQGDDKLDREDQELVEALQRELGLTA